MTWTETTVGQIAEIVSGGTPKTKTAEFWEGGDILWLTPTEVTSQEGRVISDTGRKITQAGLKASAAKMLPRNTVLLTSRATIGAVALAGAPMCTNQGFKSLIADETQVLPRFLMYWVQHNREEFESRGSGSTFKEINKSNVASIPMLLPPLDVQRRIVDLIDHIDRAVERLRLLGDRLRQAATSLRAEVFGEVKNDAIPAGEMFDMLLGRQKSARQSVGDHVRPYLRAANIGVGSLDLSDVKQMNFSPVEQVKYGLRCSDVLLVEGGSIGQTSTWTSELAGFVGFDKHVIRLRPIEGVSVSGYALQWCHWARETGLFSSVARGITIKALGFGRATALPVPVLSPEEQASLVAPLTALEACTDQQARQLAALEALRQSLLASLLSCETELPESYDRFLEEVAA